MITTAVPDGDGFRINGAKIWSTMAHVSDYLLLLATTDPNAEKASRGKTLFLVDAKQDGIVAASDPEARHALRRLLRGAARQRLRAATLT